MTDSKLGCIQSGGPELKTAPITTSSIFAVDNNEEDGWGGGEEDELGLGMSNNILPNYLAVYFSSTKGVRDYFMVMVALSVVTT